MPTKTPTTPRYVTLQEAASRYSLSVLTMRRRVSDGSLPAVRVGRRVLVREEDLAALPRPIPTMARQ